MVIVVEGGAFAVAVGNCVAELLASCSYSYVEIVDVDVVGSHVVVPLDEKHAVEVVVGDVDGGLDRVEDCFVDSVEAVVYKDSLDRVLEVHDSHQDNDWLMEYVEALNSCVMVHFGIHTVGGSHVG